VSGDHTSAVTRRHNPALSIGAAFAAAARLGLPTAVVVHVRYGPFVNVWGDGLLHASTLGLLSGADLVLALTAPGFDHVPEPMPANTAFVGPCLAPSADAARSLPELMEPGHPWVLVSLSTTAQHQEEALPAILAAVATLPVRVLPPSVASCPPSPARPPAV
jgi:hypothetical protein